MSQTVTVPFRQGTTGNIICPVNGTPGSSSLDGPWRVLTHADSPYTQQAGELKFLVDGTSGPVTINCFIANIPDEGVLIVKDWKGQAGSGGQINVTIDSGSIETPGNPGNFVSGATPATITTQGADVWWQRIVNAVGDGGTSVAVNALVEIV